MHHIYTTKVSIYSSIPITQSNPGNLLPRPTMSSALVEHLSNVLPIDVRKGKLKYLLGIEVAQYGDGIVITQKYALDISKMMIGWDLLLTSSPLQ
uniref:Reverse transcriptase Ty1/copia-type domain-containing protein n=1 Tax=Solanum lycopersicum TaxID=4081 RepID=A0A3Q7EJ44_SOLLC